MKKVEFPFARTFVAGSAIFIYSPAVAPKNILRSLLGVSLLALVFFNDTAKATV